MSKFAPLVFKDTQLNRQLASIGAEFRDQEARTRELRDALETLADELERTVLALEALE